MPFSSLPALLLACGSSCEFSSCHPCCNVFTLLLETLSHGTNAHKLFHGLPCLCCFIAAIERHHPTTEHLFGLVLRPGIWLKTKDSPCPWELPFCWGRHGWFIELSQTVYPGFELHATVSRTFQLRQSADPG